MKKFLSYRNTGLFEHSGLCALVIKEAGDRKNKEQGIRQWTNNEQRTKNKEQKTKNKKQ